MPRVYMSTEQILHTSKRTLENGSSKAFQRLARAKRLTRDYGNTLRYVRFLDDFQVLPIVEQLGRHGQLVSMTEKFTSSKHFQKSFNVAS